MRIRSLSLLFTGVIFSLSVSAQKMNDGYRHYEGTISENVLVKLDLVVAGNLADGFYSYSEKNKPEKEHSVQVSGQWDVVKKMLILKEFGNPDGSVFRLSLTGKQEMEGKWRPSEQEIELPCRLQEVYPDGTIRFNTYSKALSYTLSPLMKDSPRASYRIVVLEAMSGANRNILDSINMYIARLFFNQSLKGEGFEKLIDNESKRYFQQYSDQNLDNYSVDDKSNTFCWDKHLTVMVYSNSSNLLSLGVKYYAFTGSGKGMIVKKTLNVSTSTGQILTLNNLFENESDTAKLEPLVNNIIRQNYGIADDEKLSEKGFFADRIKLTNNFSITADKIYFFYNPYEIAGAQIGSVEVAVPLIPLKTF